MSIDAAAKEINGCVAGLTATKYRQSGNEYDVILSYQKADKSSIPDLEKIKVQGKNGLVSLANFASLKKNSGPVSINHENKARTIDDPYHSSWNASNEFYKSGFVITGSTDRTLRSWRPYFIYLCNAGFDSGFV